MTPASDFCVSCFYEILDVSMGVDLIMYLVGLLEIDWGPHGLLGAKMSDCRWSVMSGRIPHTILQ